MGDHLIKEKSMLTAFFDRDGTIAKDYPDEVWTNVMDIKLVPGAIDAMRFLRNKGYEIVILTNQYIIGEGYITYHQYEMYTQKLLETLKSKGIEIKDIFFCPHARSVNCTCRKPAVGMIENAIQKYPDIDMSRALMVGDSECDIMLAKNLNIPVFAISHKNAYEKCITLDTIKDFEKAFCEYFKMNHYKTRSL
ncbi:MAG: HAD-IIIA family hydrolase [Clostridia bacterium]|nr:HAD-IIIA family hydrolase [Clostridia bacterium]